MERAQHTRHTASLTSDTALLPWQAQHPVCAAPARDGGWNLPDRQLVRAEEALEGAPEQDSVVGQAHPPIACVAGLHHAVELRCAAAQALALATACEALHL